MDRAEQQSAAWLNGYHCGSLITKPQCPYLGSEAEDWERGFEAGRQRLFLNHQLWLQQRGEGNGPR